MTRAVVPTRPALWRTVIGGLGLTLGAGLSWAGVGQEQGWPDYGGGPDQSKFVRTRSLTRGNVARLEVHWSYPTGDQRAYQFNPIIAGDMMYVLAKDNSLVALDARTGEERWIHAHLRGITRRGINYWESADGSEARLLFAMNDYLQAIDARTGRTILSFGDNGIVDLREGLGRDPATIARVQSGTPGKVFEDLLLLGSSPGEGYFSAPGHLRAYDVRTGKLVWTFHTIPQPGEYGYETWPKDAYRYAGGVNTWGEITVDAERGLAYFPLGSPTYDFYGADRPGANLFGSSLVALDARTGERRWHYQFVHHDLWDYDPTAAPQLITIQHRGRTIDAVAQATKHGYLFVFDRVTGEPVWPIEERPVPPSDVPGETAWPTQPHPTLPPPFARQTMSSADLTPFFLSPEERAAFKARIDAAGQGLFTPPSLTRETVAVPGAVGGANWGNTAADPRRGLVFVLSQDFPSFYKLEKRSAPARNVSGSAGIAPRTLALYAQNCQTCHGANREGSLGPPLLQLGSRLGLEEFRAVIIAGRAQMPAFPHLDDETLLDMYRYFGGDPSVAQAAAAAPPPLPAGPVVAAGGAPGSNRPRRSGGAPVAAYPEGVDAPAERYTTDYGLKYPYLMAPPWSSIIAYDLNTGAIKWRAPLGQDLLAAQEGGTGTGVPRGSQRNGMIVTSTGLLFVTAKDGRIRAFDTDTGDILWEAELPSGTEGLPAMYELDGRPYLVVNASTPLTWGRASRESGIGAVGPHRPGAYVVFSLLDEPSP